MRLQAWKKCNFFVMIFYIKSEIKLVWTSKEFLCASINPSIPLEGKNEKKMLNFSEKKERLKA